MTQEVAIDPRQLAQALESCQQLFSQLTKAFGALEQRVATLSSPHPTSSARTPLASADRPAERLRSILDALPAGVVILDARGEVQQCNPAAQDMLGSPLVGEAWREVILRAFAPRSDDGHDISLRDGRIVSISTTPLGDEPGQIVLLTNVTKTRELQNTVARYEHLSAMGEMAAGLAHQIRTPLAAALLCASQLKSPALEASDRLRLADKIVGRIQHLERLINDMLVFARGGGVGTDRFTVENLEQEVRHTVEALTAGSQVRCDVVSDGVPGLLCGNREMLLSGISNLVSNALEALNGQGQLHVRVRSQAAATVDFLVQDDGPGIAADLQERIFEPFFTTRTQGTGLGLAVVRVIARAHQGDVWVESQPGQGSIFVLRLPLASGDNGADQMLSAGDTNPRQAVTAAV